MAFSDQIKSLTGIDTSNSTIDGYLDQWMTDGVKEIVNVLPPAAIDVAVTAEDVIVVAPVAFLANNVKSPSSSPAKVVCA